MDLIYMNTLREDIGVMKDYTLDLAFGSDENDFECQVTQGNHCCEEGFYLYCENTEYGGIVDGIAIDTSVDIVKYIGRTWHGILDSKIIEPDIGEDYLVVSGEANTVLNFLILRLGLSELFSVVLKDSGIKISSYKMNRYISGYLGIRKMLKASGAKLNIVYREGMVELSAVPLIDYSKDEQFDKNQMSFKARKNGNPINHVICLGKGELAQREVIHVYADESGNISHTQTLKGIWEVTAKYENTNAESLEELEQGGIDIIIKSRSSDELEFDFDSNDKAYDIGDIVGAKENITGVEVASEITKKIVTIKNGQTIISYEVGE